MLCCYRGYASADTSAKDDHLTTSLISPLGLVPHQVRRAFQYGGEASPRLWQLRDIMDWGVGDLDQEMHLGCNILGKTATVRVVTTKYAHYFCFTVLQVNWLARLRINPGVAQTIAYCKHLKVKGTGHYW